MMGGLVGRYAAVGDGEDYELAEPDEALKKCVAMSISLFSSDTFSYVAVVKASAVCLSSD